MKSDAVDNDECSRGVEIMNENDIACIKGETFDRAAVISLNKS